MASFFVPHNLESPVVGAAHGSLAGLTAVIKDMYDIAGTRTGGGSPEWLGAQQPAVKHASAVQKILDAGVTITGKTICDEFFYSIVGANAHYGTPPNLRAPGRIPGGSSSGSAAACGADICDFALGSDTGGSVRIPASLNGLFGLRATHGRVDFAGAMAQSPSFDAAGWFANGPGVFRNVGAVLLQAPSAKRAVARLLVATDAFAEADGEVAALGRQFLALAARILPEPEAKTIAPGGLDLWRDALRVAQAREVWQTFGAFIDRVKPKLGPGIKKRMAFAATVTDDHAARAREAAAAARAQLRALISPGTVVVMPTAPSIAPRLTAAQDELELFRVRSTRLTCMASLAGLPQMTIPIGTVAGCPVGLSFMAWPGGDEALLDLACQLAPFCGIFSQ